MTVYELSGDNYSEVDASNSNSGPAGWAVGQAPSNVGAAGRAFMGSVKRSYDRDHAGAWCTVGGTANTVTLTYSVAPTSYVQGEKYAFKATGANSGATTADVNSLGAKNVFAKTASGPAACVGGEIQDGDIVEIEYDGTQFQIISGTAGGVASIADATNGGINFSASTGAVSANLKPSDLLTKATPTTSDSLVIQDAAASNAAKTATIASMAASAATTLTGTDATQWLTASGFAGNKSIVAIGYYKLPGGLIVQWGNVSIGGSGTATVTFPVAFPSQLASVSVTYNTNAPPANSCTAQAISNAQMTVANGSGAAQSIFWMAIGF
jgi:hypothetical protein